MSAYERNQQDFIKVVKIRAKQAQLYNDMKEADNDVVNKALLAWIDFIKIQDTTLLLGFTNDSIETLTKIQLLDGVWPEVAAAADDAIVNIKARVYGRNAAKTAAAKARETLDPMIWLSV
jgi:hypothetical protein